LPELVDIATAAKTWFSQADAGSTCNTNVGSSLFCSAPSNDSPDGCEYTGEYAVWNSADIDCFAFDLLEKAVLDTCADGESGDCGCGIYLDSGAGKCLVATYTYHVSGKFLLDMPLRYAMI
jgi:hypothetical protein